MKLIDKDALVAWIKRRKQVAYGWMETAPNDAIEAEFELCDDILSFIDTLEVKDVDLDLTLDIDDVLKNNGINPYTTGAKIIKEALYKAIDKHISKAQKGEEV